MIDPAAEVIRAGERAEAILGDDVFTGAVDAVRADIMAAWRNSAPEDREVRETAWHMTTLLDAVVSKLRGALASGYVEADRLEAEQRERGR